MTPAEADQRIILSRQTLQRYVAMVSSGQTPVDDIGMMHDELELLERIAEHHSGKVEKISSLAQEWMGSTSFRVQR